MANKIENKTGNNREIKNKHQKRNNKSLAFGTIAIVAIVAVIAISVIFNIIFANLIPQKIDLTSNKEFTISNEAKEYLKTVDKEVTIVGLFDEVSKDMGTIADYNDQYVSMQVDKLVELLNQYENINDKISVKFVDPEKDTLYLQRTLGEAQAKDYEKGDFIVSSGNRITRITSKSLVYSSMQQDYYGQFVEMPYAPNFDGAFVGAIINVTSEEDHIIGVVTDHNEYPINQYYNNMKSDIENRAFILEEMKLATTDDLSKYNILLFLGSKTDLTTLEAAKLTEYLNAGGNAIFLIDSIQNGPTFENLNTVLSNYNLAFNNDLVNEGTQNYLIEPQILYEKLEFSQGDFLEDLNNNHLIMPISRSIERLNLTVDYLQMYPVVYTTDQATFNNYTTGNTTTGRKLLGAAVESTGSGNTSKILVMGSSGFVVDSFESLDMTNTGLQVMSKTLSWMEGTEDFNVPVKVNKYAKMTISDSTSKVLGVITIVLIPLLIVSIGLLVWLRRRHL